MSYRNASLMIAFFLASGQIAAQGTAEVWPTRAVKFVVGVQAGGTNDAIARIFAKSISESTGQPMLVENRPGASGNIGAEFVMRSEADGSTLYVPTSSIAIRPALYKDMTFSFTKDFKAIALLAKVPNVLSVNPLLPVNNLKELVEYSKKHPGAITYGSGSAGSSGHITGESIRIATGANFLHVAYKGSAGALNDASAGHINAIVDNLPSSLHLIRSGRLKPIAVTSAVRSPLLPDVPTVAESGIPNFEMVAWFGLIAPKATPKAVVDRVNAEVRKALSSKDIRAYLEKDGAQSAPMSPDQFQDFIMSETTKWGDIVRKAQITLE
ncbi:Bug family tripartite tricarboxylate transporter substrate binding protein [Ottowia thiooxydans]|uniref:Tripartite-type tricarboxylate transporter receptor subunit TctC n=1 Tax=Ottowia thiooxydans TaxID=219182 RepID=A0ABV2Q4Q6_9BURK